MLQAAYYQAEVDNLSQKLKQVKADKARVANDPSEVDVMAKLVEEYLKLETQLEHAKINLQHAKQKEILMTEAEMKALAARASLSNTISELFSDSVIQSNAANTVNQMQFEDQKLADEVQSSLIKTDEGFSNSVRKAYLENSSIRELSLEEQEEVLIAVKESIAEAQEDYITNQLAYIKEAQKAIDRNDFEKAQELLEIAATNARDRADDFDLNMKVNLMAKSLYKGFEEEYGPEYYKNEDFLEKLGLNQEDIKALRGASEEEYKEAIKMKLEEKINDQIIERDVSAYDALFLEENFLGPEFKDTWEEARDRAKNTYNNLPKEHMDIMVSARKEAAALQSQAEKMPERIAIQDALNKAKANFGMLDEPYEGARNEVLAVMSSSNGMQVPSTQTNLDQNQEVATLQTIKFADIKLSSTDSTEISNNYQPPVYSEQAREERNSGWAVGVEDA